MTPLSAPFYIDTTSGVIRVKTSLDRESVDNYTLTVTATDRDPNIADRKSSSVNVTMTLTDANDNEPVFSPDHYKVRLDDDDNGDDTYYPSNETCQGEAQKRWSYTREYKTCD